MQKQRIVHGETVRQVASDFGCSASHISRVERGDTKPSRALVQFYEERYLSDGLLHSLFEVVEHAGEQQRRRLGGHRPRGIKAIEGDATAFVDDTVPHGTLMLPGEVFVKTWRIRNVGTVAWIGRQLERQGPITGPGLITSPRLVAIPDTQPGELARIQIALKAQTFDSTTIAYFKMVDAMGLPCFPDEHQLGLDVLIAVRRNDRGLQ